MAWQRRPRPCWAAWNLKLPDSSESEAEDGGPTAGSDGEGCLMKVAFDEDVNLKLGKDGGIVSAVSSETGKPVGFKEQVINLSEQKEKPAGQDVSDGKPF